MKTLREEILEKWCEEQAKAIDSVYNGLKEIGA